MSKSKQNIAVLTDYAAMEAYKGDTLASIYKSMEILTRFSDQVVVLKNTPTVCGLSGRSSGLRKRLIDNSQTKTFARYARDLQNAENGNIEMQHQLLAHGKEATTHLDRMLADAKSIGRVFDDLTKAFPKEERRLVRHKDPYTPKMIDKIVLAAIGLAGEIFKSHPEVKVLPNNKELPNTFIFRARCVHTCSHLNGQHLAA